MVEEEGRRCISIAGDIGDESFCQQAVSTTVDAFGHLDILVNNAGEQHPQESIEKITREQLERTFRTNIFAMFYLTKAALPHLREDSVVINTSSVTAYKGSPQLLDYSATKGAIIVFTRSLSQALAERRIRVNAVAPGPDSLSPSSPPRSRRRRSNVSAPTCHEAPRPAGGGRAELRFPCLGRRLVHDGTDLAPQWREPSSTGEGAPPRTARRAPPSHGARRSDWPPRSDATGPLGQKMPGITL